MEHRIAKLYKLLYPFDNTTILYGEEELIDLTDLTPKIDEVLTGMCNDSIQYPVLLVISRALDVHVTESDTVNDMCIKLRSVYRNTSEQQRKVDMYNMLFKDISRRYDDIPKTFEMEIRRLKEIGDKIIINDMSLGRKEIQQILSVYIKEIQNLTILYKNVLRRGSLRSDALSEREFRYLVDNLIVDLRRIVRSDPGARPDLLTRYHEALDNIYREYNKQK